MLTATALDDFRLLCDALDAVPSAVMLIDLDENQVTSANRRARDMFDLARGSLDLGLASVIEPQTANGPSVATRRHVPLRDRDGIERRAELFFGETGRRVVAIVVPDADSTRCQQLDLMLSTEAGLDPLTRLPNRHHFERRLVAAIERQKQRPDCLFAVLFIDLDGFKMVNDRHGHLAGDRVLRDVAERLSAGIRPGDLVARVGGDEFTVLVDALRDPCDAVEVARRITTQMQAPFKVEEDEISMGASIGIAIGEGQHTNPEAVVHEADRAMYRAKTLGVGIGTV